MSQPSFLTSPIVSFSGTFLIDANECFYNFLMEKAKLKQTLVSPSRATLFLQMLQKLLWRKYAGTCFVQSYKHAV